MTPSLGALQAPCSPGLSRVVLQLVQAEEVFANGDLDTLTQEHLSRMEAGHPSRNGHCGQCCSSDLWCMQY